MPDALTAALGALRRGRVVVYPTDTLYGLAVRADDAHAVRALTELKGRPEGLPISVAVSSTEEVDSILLLTPPARAFVRRRLPGPFTVLGRLRPDAAIADGLAASDGTLGVRVPDHPVARELARRAGPVTATSANRHGAPTARRLARIRAAFGGRVAAYLDGAPRPSGRASELIDLTGRRPRPRPRRGR